MNLVPPFLAGPGPRWFSIPAHRPFVRDLAAGLFDAMTPLGPDGLSQALLLVPTRRGARAMAQAFAAGGKAVLLPQIRALGDLEAGEPPFEPGDLALDIDPAVSPQRRRYELARICAAHADKLGRSLGAKAALEMADALGGLLDSLQIEEREAGCDLDGLVDGDLARHWQVSARFLCAALEDWRGWLAAQGLIDVSQRRVRLLRALEGAWRLRPPTGVVIAAGAVGSTPATAALLGVIAAAPHGAVVLPGLDEGLADDAWAKIDEQHPQSAFKRLLDQVGVRRDQVRPWRPDADARGRWRRRLINEALRPADATDDWLRQINNIRDEAQGVDPFAEGLAGLSLVAARSDEEAALACALLLREALETPGRTAALVTPDQALTRRVCARLARWGVAADSSAGAPLAAYPAAVLALHLAALAADPLDPVRLLACAKHPLTRLGLDEAALRRARRAFEGGGREAGRQGLRGPRPADAAALDRRLADAPEGLELWRRMQAAVALAAAPFKAGKTRVPTAARALAQGLEALAADADHATGGLWRGAGGEGLGGLIAGLIADADGLPAVTAPGFADLLERLIAGETVRTGGGAHPRLRILGAIEARMTTADTLVLAGLEEGTWPQAPPTDPFLSRPMRKALGLPPPERQVGVAAHDFAQAACAGEVVLVHAERRGGSPAVESRWLWRLRTLARGAGVELPQRTDVLDWAQVLDAPGRYAPVKRPAPTPPTADRPRELAVTRIEALTRDPYSVWARDILKLYRLDRPDEAVDVRARGKAIHAAFERFALANPHPGGLPGDAAEQFETLYVEALRQEGMPAAALVREAALAREIGQWVAELEARRRAAADTILVERKGELTVDTQLGPFALTARADRIELTPDGLGHILDYKTGAPPTPKMVGAGFSPQLTLTAAILMNGGFDGVRAQAGDLTYLRVTGRKPAGHETTILSEGLTSADMAQAALEGLVQLIDRYADADQPYASRTAPQFVKTYAGDYDHLARVFEWSTAGEEGEE